jgi:hypothetical protein
MAKTELRNFYLERLAFVNDQLCYFHFADQEVKKNFSNLNNLKSKNLTSELFVKNPYSKRINVIFEDLLKFRERAMGISNGMSLSFGVEHLIYYLDEVRELKLKISHAAESDLKNDTPEDRMQNNLKHWGSKKPDKAIFKTIKYFRLRRNHIIHARTDLTEKFERFLRNESHYLNSFWTSKTSLEDLDFSSKNVIEFSVPEIYTCAKLLRICLEEVDKAISFTFTREDLVKYMAKSILEKDKHLKAAIKPLSRKVRGSLIYHFNTDIGSEFIKSSLESLFEDV